MDKNNTTYSEIIIFFIIFVTIVFLTYKVYQNESYLNHVSDKNQETYNKLTGLRIKTEDNTKHIQSLMESTYSEQLDEARDLMYYAGFDTEEFEAIREIRAYGNTIIFENQYQELIKVDLPNKTIINYRD